MDAPACEFTGERQRLHGGASAPRAWGMWNMSTVGGSGHEDDVKLSVVLSMGFCFCGGG